MWLPLAVKHCFSEECLILRVDVFTVLWGCTAGFSYFMLYSQSFLWHISNMLGLPFVRLLFVWAVSVCIGIRGEEPGFFWKSKSLRGERKQYIGLSLYQLQSVKTDLLYGEYSAQCWSEELISLKLVQVNSNFEPPEISGLVPSVFIHFLFFF